MKLTKDEKELLKFAGNTALGCIQTNINSPAVNTAFRLSQKGLLKRYISNLPFSGSSDYWNLTQLGWTECAELNKRKLNGTNKRKSKK